MAYKLLDQNGNKMIINGMNKGYIKVPYNYQGLEMYNVNRTNRYYDYPFFQDVKCIYINGNRYSTNDTLEHKFINEGYEPTQITISGRRWTEGFDHYEIYLNNELVTSGVFPDKVNTDVYVINKEANTSVIISGEWDSTNSKYIYNITTNAIIHKEDSYEWFNPIHTGTISLTVGEGKDITSTQNYNKLFIPYASSIKSRIMSSIGVTSQQYINITKVELDESTLYWYNPNNDTKLYNAKATTSSSATSGTGVLYSTYRNYRDRGVCQWSSSSKADVTNYLGKSLYGYYVSSTTQSFGNVANSGSGNFCNSSGSKPTFTIIVTYEY